MFLQFLLLLSAVRAFAPAVRQDSRCLQSATIPSSPSTAAASTTGLFAISDGLAMTLKKSSKTLSVLLDYDSDHDSDDKTTSEGDLITLSMQLRKIKASAIVTADLEAARVFVEEQRTAVGNFPEPCPIIYHGDNIAGAAEAGVSAVIVSGAAVDEDAIDLTTGGVGVIKTISISEAGKDDTIINQDENAFLIDGDDEEDASALLLGGAIPSGSVIIASLSSMQDENEELEKAKRLKALGVTSILLKKACVGDGEDIEYASFAIDGMTKKKSSTFNMSGLTGSTNGHFGGVGTSTTATWLRTKKEEEAVAVAAS